MGNPSSLALAWEFTSTIIQIGFRTRSAPQSGTDFLKNPQQCIVGLYNFSTTLDRKQGVAWTSLSLSYSSYFTEDIGMGSSELQELRNDSYWVFFSFMFC